MPIGDAVNANLACVTSFFCHADEAEAVRRGAEGVNFIGYSLGHYYVFGRHKPGRGDLWSDYRQSARRAGFRSRCRRIAVGDPDRLGAKAVKDGTSGLRGAMGTPEQVRDYLRRYEACGVDQVILSCAAGRNRHEHIMETLELFAREVMPEFAERDEQHQRDKAKRLAPVLDAVMARKPARRPPAARIRATRSPPTPVSTPIEQQSEKFHRWLDDYAAKIAAGEDVSKRLA